MTTTLPFIRISGQSSNRGVCILSMSLSLFCDIHAVYLFVLLSWQCTCASFFMTILAMSILLFVFSDVWNIHMYFFIETCACVYKYMCTHLQAAWPTLFLLSWAWRSGIRIIVNRVQTLRIDINTPNKTKTLPAIESLMFSNLRKIVVFASSICINILMCRLCGSPRETRLTFAHAHY